MTSEWVSRGHLTARGIHAVNLHTPRLFEAASEQLPTVLELRGLRGGVERLGHEQRMIPPPPHSETPYRNGALPRQGANCTSVLVPSQELDPWRLRSRSECVPANPDGPTGSDSAGNGSRGASPIRSQLARSIERTCGAVGGSYSDVTVNSHFELERGSGRKATDLINSNT